MFSRIIFILAVFTLVSCAKEPAREARVVLDVAGRQVTMEELDRFVRASVQQESPVVSPEVMAALFEEFVEEQLLLRAADDSGVVADPETVADRASFEDPLRFPVGVRDVLVGGECVVREERLTGRQPGRIVK